MDAAHTDFDDDSFDLIYSCAMLEHVEDLSSVLAETRRILKPGGVAVFGIHLFASRSGGHNLQDRDANTGKLVAPPPWDHLRQNLYPTKLYLNRLRERDFRMAFEHAGLQVLDWRTVPSPPEDAALLTDELERELAAKGYTRTELLTEAVTAFVTKRE